MNATESIGLSGLLVSQRLLEVTGQNISNANTPGYHRQVADVVAKGSGVGIGQGVDVAQVRRLFDQSVEDAITRNTFQSGDVTAQLSTLQQVEDQLNPGDGSIHDLLEKFFNQVETMAGQPDDPAQRSVLLNSATALSDKLNTVFGNIQTLQSDVSDRVTRAVSDINDLTGKIAGLNLQIQRLAVQGADTNNLSDQRDQLVQSLAQLIDVRVVPQDQGTVNVLSGGVPLVLGAQNIGIESVIGDDKKAAVRAVGLPASLQTTGGQLNGLFELQNGTLQNVRNKLETLTTNFIHSVDEVQATGMGLTPLTQLHGTRGVTNVNLPLDRAGLDFPPQAGAVFVTLTNLSTGERKLSEVDIDPSSQSLRDVAAAFSSISNLQGVVDPKSGTLALFAANGFTLDFAGRTAALPQSMAIMGTSTVAIDGAYDGTRNEKFNFTVKGSGTVGVSTDLTLEARNSAGAMVGSWNIGQGYEPGAALAPLDGVSVKLSSGTLNDGDTFSAQVVANADTAGLLPALGLGTFFDGGVGMLHVSNDLLHDPGRLAGSKSGLPGDGGNFADMAALRDQPLANTNSTFSEFYANLTADVGGKIQDLQQRQTAQQTLGQSLDAQRQSSSGVDPNEELTRILQYQRSFQLSARFLSIVNDTLAELLKISS